jgi:hypothetical protein
MIAAVSCIAAQFFPTAKAFITALFKFIWRSDIEAVANQPGAGGEQKSRPQ